LRVNFSFYCIKNPDHLTFADPKASPSLKISQSILLSVKLIKLATYSLDHLFFFVFIDLITVK